MAETELFHLAVLAADKKFYNDMARNLIVQTDNGRLSFLAHHEEMIAALCPGEMEIQKEDGAWIHVVGGYGSMVFAHNRATVLVETVETPEEVDERKAREVIERIREQQRQKMSIDEYRISQAAMARALSRLKFKGRHYTN